MDGMPMTRWVVEPDASGKANDRAGWTVVKADKNGTRTPVRSRWTSLSCIEAQVIAEELNTAHRLGRIEAIDAMRAQVLGD